MLKNPILVALDVDQPEKALEIAFELQDIVGGFKLGPRLVMKEGSRLIDKLSQLLPVFVDMKHFDIPSTMISAIRTSFDSGATFVTVHALAGFEALTQCAILEKELNEIRPFKILCVSILTSWDQSSFPSNFKSQTPTHHVDQLSDLVLQSGLDGLVCSGHELDLLINKKLFKVVPGIRGAQDLAQDQKRVMTPGEAIQKGASALVVGRPIIDAQDMKKAAKAFVSFSA